jgi:TGF-beta propeptide
MKSLKPQLAVLLLSALCLLTGAYGQITPSADAYTNTATPTTNYGAKTLLDVDGATQIAYIQFNLSSIPASASVTQATLKLYVNTVTAAGSFNVDYVSGTWAESKITSSLAPALGAAIVSSVSITTASKNQYILINITPAVVAWLNGSQANDGIALVANGTFNATFDSKENTTTSHPPELDIVFAGGGGITGITTASGSGLTGGGTSGTLNLSLTNACASGQVLAWSGTAWACTNLKGGGTITGVTAGTDLTGGGTSGTDKLNVDTTKVPQLATANTFTANQTVNGNLTARERLPRPF